MAKVLNKAKDVIPADAVYIGRPSKWGNPFRIKQESERADAVVKYRRWLKSQPALVAAARTELKGKDLVCWCSPKACHGHVLMEIVEL